MTSLPPPQASSDAPRSTLGPQRPRPFAASNEVVAPVTSHVVAPFDTTPVNVHPAGASSSSSPFVMPAGTEPSVKVKTIAAVEPPATALGETSATAFESGG